MPVGVYLCMGRDLNTEWNHKSAMKRAKLLGSKHGAEPGNYGLDGQSLMAALGDRNFRQDAALYADVYADAFLAAYKASRRTDA